MTMKKFGTFAVAGALCLLVAGCSGEPLSTREQGTLIGGGAGAVGGALIGGAVGHPAAGAAIGGVGGAATGYAIGNHEQNQQDYYRGDN
jgi:osmotically inducible lipoprotein OsmB